MNKKGGLSVSDIIEFLKQCPPKAIVYYEQNEYLINREHWNTDVGYIEYSYGDEVVTMCTYDHFMEEIKTQK